MILSTVFVVLLASQTVIGFSADSGSRAVPDKSSSSKGNQERLLIPGIIALWKLRPLIKTFNGFGSFGGTFGATFGGGGIYNGFYPFPGGVYGAAGAGAGGLGVGGLGYPGVYPGGIHPIGYPYPAIGGPGPFNIRGNKPLESRPTKSADIDEDAGRLDVIDDEPAVTTIKPGFIQSVVEFTSPFFHAGQRIESRARPNSRSSIDKPSIRRN